MAKFTNLNEYISFVRAFKRKQKLIPGLLYVFDYRFMKNPEIKKVPAPKLRFYDFKPAVFFLQRDRKNRTLTGLNFHQMPVKARQFWLTKIAPFKKENRELIKLPLTKMRALFKKSVIGLRQYNIQRIRNPRIVPFENWEELFNFSAKTYFRATLNEVDQRYRAFIPKNKV